VTFEQIDFQLPRRCRNARPASPAIKLYR
jgi:hypothetical protein